jgi:hypothetical protein
LNPNGATSQAQLGGNVIGREATALEQRHDSPAACIKQLLSKHFGHTSLSENRIAP